MIRQPTMSSMHIKNVFSFLLIMILYSGCSNRDSLSSINVNDPIIPPKDGWADFSNFNHRPLENYPEIQVIESTKSFARVRATNRGKSTLQYIASGGKYIQLFQEMKVNGEWVQEKWDWCGTGKSSYEIKPNENVELIIDFWENGEEEERMWGLFNEDNSNKNGFVILAEKPK